jgi:hypothetical protein
VDGFREDFECLQDKNRATDESLWRKKRHPYILPMSGEQHVVLVPLQTNGQE